MSAVSPTAGAILREIDRRQYQASIADLYNIADADRDAVVLALGGVPRNARIDIAVLVATLRREAAERAARRPPADASIYERLLVSQGYVAFRSPTPASSDGEARPTRRRQVPRRRLARAQDGEQADVPHHVPTGGEVRLCGPHMRPTRPFLHGRTFVGGEEIGGPALEHFRPPWILPDETDQETAAA